MRTLRRLPLGSVPLALLALLHSGCGASATKGTNGANGKTTLISTAAETAGANCASGGQRMDVGLDADGSGTLDAAEVSRTVYVCAGAAGAAGITPTVTPVQSGGTCGTAGGMTIQVGTGQPSTICNGAAGTPAPSVTITQIAMPKSQSNSPVAQSACAFGGYLLQIGANDPVPVCNGAPGTNGTPGNPAVCAGNSLPWIEGVSVPPVPFYPGETQPLHVEAGDVDDDKLTYSISGSGGIFTPAEGEGTGNFLFTPVQPGGPYNFSVIVTDGCQLALSSFTIDSINQGWTQVGRPSFGGMPYTQSIAVLGGVPYVAYAASNTGDEHLMKFDGSTWTDAGQPLGAGFYPSLATCGGKLYAADGQGMVYDFNGAAWARLTNYADGSAIAVKLACDGQELYASFLFREESRNLRIGVARYNGLDAWTSVDFQGSAGLGVYVSADYNAFDLYVEDGTPYVLFSEAMDSESVDSLGWTVMADLDGSWTVLGAHGNAPTLYGDHLAVVDGWVYAAIGNDGGFGGVWRYDGEGNWQPLPGITTGSEPAMAVSNGQLYVLAMDPNSLMLQLQTWNGDGWVKVGNDGLDFASLRGDAMVVDNGTFWVSYGTLADPGTTSAMKITPPQQKIPMQ